ncbi:hypothetical protein BKA65DRAFT_596264 [Rhexocercosporidium sp. MPI-PUGE-AT-0058]|nr:hypothetical protein BKA65DRAFT_596264 [Rhexocercosporidium sp. MPI-PUGE-AT-0058]
MAVNTSLRELELTIRQICSICGVTGVFIGVLHHGKVVYEETFGFQDVEAKLLPHSFTGIYRNMVKTFDITVFEKDAKLWMNFKGNPLEIYLLTYWKNDIFSWLMARDEGAKRARNMSTHIDMLEIVFVDYGIGSIHHTT